MNRISGSPTNTAGFKSASIRLWLIMNHVVKIKKAKLKNNIMTTVVHTRDSALNPTKALAYRRF
jgi:hypothetical protein